MSQRLGDCHVMLIVSCDRDVTFGRCGGPGAVNRDQCTGLGSLVLG